MGSRGSSTSPIERTIPPATTESQLEALRMERDYRIERYAMFENEFADWYDDRANQDPYFDRDEYVDNFDKLRSRIEDDINEITRLINRTDYVDYSQELQNLWYFERSRLVQLMTSYSVMLQHQRMEGRYRDW